VQPLLTPDNYAEHVVPLIRSATKSVYFQNQSLDARQSGENGDIFESLLQALLDKQKNPAIDRHEGLWLRYQQEQGAGPNQLPHQGHHHRQSDGPRGQPQLDARRDHAQP
jgi:hypothetical protein